MILLAHVVGRINYFLVVFFFLTACSSILATSVETKRHSAEPSPAVMVDVYTIVEGMVFRRLQSPYSSLPSKIALIQARSFAKEAMVHWLDQPNDANFQVVLDGVEWMISTLLHSP